MGEGPRVRVKSREKLFPHRFFTAPILSSSLLRKEGPRENCAYNFNIAYSYIKIPLYSPFVKGGQTYALRAMIFQGNNIVSLS
jgi:hypothetical protein